ncbi:MAG: heavy-metal-associated domain-containing protein [Gammaproteobacteria bacterium]
MATFTLTIPGMKCGGCVSTVESTLKALSNIETVAVDLESKQVTIEGDIAIDAAISAVTDAGFPAQSL